MATPLPTFAAGEYYKIQAAIDNGILSYPSYVYIRDEKKLAFIDQDNSINRIVGDNKESVINVTTLPDISEGDESVLYILEFSKLSNTPPFGCPYLLFFLHL